MKKTLLLTAILGLFAVAGCSGGGNSAASGTAPQQSNSSEASSGAPAAAGGNALNVYNWSDYVDPQTLKDFEAANKLKVRYDTYDSNETLEAKLLTGASGYDLVTPGIMFVGREIQAGAFQPLDKAKITNYANIDPQLLKMLDQVDPGNKYVVPYFWGMNTIGINRDKVEKALGGKLPDNAWDLVFKPEYTAKLKSCGISILDSPTEVFPMVLHYQGKDPAGTNADDLKAAAEVLKKVHGDIKRFSSSGYIDDLARGDLCVVLGYGGDINIAAGRAEEAKNGVKVEALVPKEGVGIWIDSFAIPKGAQNLDNAYKYLNYTLDPKVAAQNGNFVKYPPSSKPAKDLMDKKYTANPSIFIPDDVVKQSFVMKPMAPDMVKLAVRLWQGVKAGE